jgi:hypothetical protein
MEVDNITIIMEDHEISLTKKYREARQKSKYCATIWPDHTDVYVSTSKIASALPLAKHTRREKCNKKLRIFVNAI